MVSASKGKAAIVQSDPAERHPVHLLAYRPPRASPTPPPCPQDTDPLCDYSSSTGRDPQHILPAEETKTQKRYLFSNLQFIQPAFTAQFCGLARFSIKLHLMEHYFFLFCLFFFTHFPVLARKITWMLIRSFNTKQECKQDRNKSHQPTIKMQPKRLVQHKTHQDMSNSRSNHD